MKDPEAAIHARWLKHRNRITGEAGYLERWYWEQCADCLHWCPLSGPMGNDWGVCQNPDSSFDAMARFEHDGCAEFHPKPGQA